MNLGEKPNTNVACSKKHGLKLSLVDDETISKEWQMNRQHLNLYYDGIELYSEISDNLFHIWCCDNNVDFHADIFDEYGHDFNELMEHAMQSLGDYSNSISRSFRGIEKMSDMLAKSFLEGGVVLSREERESMEREKMVDGNIEVLEQIWNVKE